MEVKKKKDFEYNHLDVEITQRCISGRARAHVHVHVPLHLTAVRTSIPQGNILIFS